MKRISRGALAPLLVLGWIGVIAPPAGASGSFSPQVASQSTGGAQRVGVGRIVRGLTQSAGVDVLCDSSSAATLVAPSLGVGATRETLEERLDSLVKAMGDGAAWAKVHLPTPKPGHAYTGDSVAQFALAQANLFGRAGVAEAGKVEILGKQVPTATAAPMVETLELKPYYVVTGPRVSPAALASGMSDAQRRELVDRMINDDGARQAFFQQYGQIMGEIFRALPADKRNMTFAIPGGMANLSGTIRVITAPPGTVPPPPPN